MVTGTKRRRASIKDQLVGISVGTTVSVWFDHPGTEGGVNGDFYVGTVTKANGRKLYVEYEDGEKRWEDPREGKFKVRITENTNKLESEAVNFSTANEPRKSNNNDDGGSRKTLAVYPVGTLFFKRCGQGRSVGEIIGFDGHSYKVRYPRSGQEEVLSGNALRGSGIQHLNEATRDGDGTDDDSDDTDEDDI